MKYNYVKTHTPSWCHITYHALDQFIARWVPDASPEDAALELYSLINTSTTSGKTHRGDQIYVSGHRPEIRMVVKDRDVCVTVLPRGTIDSALLACEEEMNAWNNYVEERLAQFNYELSLLQEEVNEIERQKKVLNEKKSLICRKIDSLKMNFKKEKI